MKFNRDLAANANPRRVGNAVMSLLNRLQDFTAEQQALSVTILFDLLAEHFGIRHADLFVFAHNLTGTNRPEFAAARAYIQNELT